MNSIRARQGNKSASYLSHETIGAAPVDDGDVVLVQDVGELARGFDVADFAFGDAGQAIGGSAEDAYDRCI